MNKQRYDVNHEEMKTLPYIIAVDFDGTLVEDNFPKIGAIKEENWKAMLKARENGAKIILWTCRDGKNLRDAVDFCADYGFEFDAINENIKETKEMFSNDTRKVYANEYWDDKAVMSFSNHVLSLTRGDGSEMR